MIEKLQYITQESSNHSHIDCVREGCIAGVKWIQLRVKGKSDEEYLTIAKEAKIICDLYEVILIINDNVEVAKQVNAHGVHLGRADMYISEARSILGEHAIIGGTANSQKEVERLIEQGANYIGLGPFRFTSTKKELSHFLGLKGYVEMLNKLKIKYALSEIPIIAVGGIEMEDVENLLETGVFGIAVSGVLTKDYSNTEKLLTILNNELWPN